ncbi:hypothetical protein BGZ94_000307 [Podila epigama]|nr:hypothetical protein BGZ94_000307 [Podila epigama]
MSESIPKRAVVAKPQKKKKEPVAPTEATNDAKASKDEPLIDIPAPKKKKERHVKTETEIAAKLERKRLRKEAELAKRIASQHSKRIGARINPSSPASASTPKANNTTETPTPVGVAGAAGQNKVPKWKRFLKNTSEIDNAEKFKNTSYKVKGDDGSGDESDSDSNKEAKKDDSKISSSNSNDSEITGNKRKAGQEAEVKSNTKKGKQDDETLAKLDTSTPGLAYLMEWKRSRGTWKFQKLRQVWLLSHLYSDKDIPDSHWEIFLEYIHDLKGAARTTVIQEAQKIVEAPDEDEENGDADNKETTSEAETKDGDEEMTQATDAEESITPGEEAMMSEEEKAEAGAARNAKIEAKRAAKVKSSRALEVLRLLA